MNKEELLNDKEFIDELAKKLAERLMKTLQEEEKEEKEKKETKKDSIIDDEILEVIKKLDEIETKRLIRRAIYRRLVRLF